MYKKVFFSILFALFISCRIAIAQKPKIKVFILSGQSNMVGTSQPLVSELHNRSSYAEIRCIYDKDSNWERSNCKKIY